MDIKMSYNTSLTRQRWHSQTSSYETKPYLWAAATFALFFFCVCNWKNIQQADHTSRRATRSHSARLKKSERLISTPECLRHLKGITHVLQDKCCWRLKQMRSVEGYYSFKSVYDVWGWISWRVWTEQRACEIESRKYGTRMCEGLPDGGNVVLVLMILLQDLLKLKTIVMEYLEL